MDSPTQSKVNRCLAIAVIFVIVAYALFSWAARSRIIPTADTLSFESWVLIENLSPASDITVTSDHGELQLPLAFKMTDADMRGGSGVERIADSKFRGRCGDVTFEIYSPSGQTLDFRVRSSVHPSDPITFFGWYGAFVEQDEASLRENVAEMTIEELKRRVDAGEVQLIEP